MEKSQKSKAIGRALMISGKFFASKSAKIIKFCHLFWTFQIFPKPLNGMSGSTMYFRASYTLSPTILHILPHHFTMVPPLERQLNKKLIANFNVRSSENSSILIFSHRIEFKKSNIRLRIFGKISKVQGNWQSFNDFWKFFRLKISRDH